VTRLKKLEDIYVSVIQMALSFLQKNNPVNNQASIGLEYIRFSTGVFAVPQLEGTLLITSEPIIEAEH
jgi:hypothetical protein